jgi:hypothetical protein
MESTDTRSDWIVGVAAVTTGLATLTFVLFPLALPIIALTTLALLPLAIPVVFLGVAAALLAGAWLAGRTVLTRLRRKSSDQGAAEGRRLTVLRHHISR